MNKNIIKINEAELRNMVAASIKKNMIKEEEESDTTQETNDSSFKGKAVDFLSKLEGYHLVLKVLHWSADNNAKHLLTDKIDGAIHGFEDKVAEVTMGILNEKISEGLEANKPTSTELEGLLSELEQDVLDFLNEFESERAYRGLVNVCDDFLSDLDTYKYLKDLK